MRLFVRAQQEALVSPVPGVTWHRTRLDFGVMALVKACESRDESQMSINNIHVPHCQRIDPPMTAEE